MSISDQDRARLVRILNLLGSDQAGERAAAALAAHRLVAALGTDWASVLAAAREPQVIVKRVRDWDVDAAEAAAARLRQLKATTERQERQIKALRTRVNTLTERERKRRAAEEEEAG